MNTWDWLEKVGIPLIAVLVTVAVVYLTANHALRRERANGRARLLELCRRYVLNFINAFDPQTRALRTDRLGYEFYVQELERIVDDLDKLLGNAYVERLILEHPRVTKLLVILRRELIEHRVSATESLTGMNAESLDEIFDLMNVVRKDLSVASDSFDREMLAVEPILRDAGILPNSTDQSKPASPASMAFARPQ